MLKSASIVLSLTLLSYCALRQQKSSGEVKAVADAASMTQVAPDQWSIACNNGTVETRTTADILADKVCVTSTPASCIATACELIGSFGCNSQEKIERISSACRGASSSCLEVACNLIGSSSCNEIPDVENILSSCKSGVQKAQCLTVACDFMGSSSCNDAEDVKPILDACSGRSEKASCLKNSCPHLGSFGCNDATKVIRILNNC
ncbi:MAG: hypothetical protein NT027_16065 [Proteobacteria bacterium]|nr:hypothetical protein [Pseudomonadota bacterium]